MGETFLEGKMISFVCFVNLMQTRVIWEEESLVEKMSALDCPVDKAVRHFSPLVIDVGEPSLL